MEHKLTGEEMYRKINRKRRLTSLFTLIAILIALLFDLFIGSSGMSLKDIIVVLWQGPGVKSIETSIIWNIRLPMTLICLTVGASLGLAGTQMQTILANPLASPYTLGVSSAAGFGAAIAFISGFPFKNMPWVNAPFMAFMMTLTGTMAIYF